MLYLSPLLKERYPELFAGIAAATDVTLLPFTQDIWLRDFMPIKDAEGNWVLFRYFPKYLKNPKLHHLISDNKRVCDAINLNYTYTDIILDGGAVVYFGEEYFISERVLEDNAKLSIAQIVAQLQTLLKTDKIHLLTYDADDFTAHMDGILAFVDKDTVLMSDIQEPYAVYIKSYLQQLGKEIIPFPYNISTNRTKQSAKGVYINFLIDKNVILLPVFDLKEDQEAMAILSRLYPQYKIAAINCKQLATHGGLLHCISWEE